MFRDILRKYKEAYWVAETKKDKRDVVAKAIDEFHAGGGRFVEKVVLTSDHCPGKNCYEIVEGPAVFLKARQAFRYLLRGSEAEDQKDKPSVGEPEMSTLPSQASRGTSLSLVEESREPPAASPNLQARGPISPNVKEEEIEEFTLRNAIDLQRLASLAADAPPLLTSLQNSPYLNSPWRQHELSSPAVRRMSDIMLGRTNLLMNSMRYPGSFTWPQDSNTHVNQRIANSDLRVGGEQYSLLSSLSPFEMRPTLHDTGWDRLLSPSSDYLVSKPSQSGRFANP